MKWIDCSACIGLDSINRVIINHENYPVYEKVRQAAIAEELLKEMDFCGIDEAFVYHQGMIETDPAYGNKLILQETAKANNLRLEDYIQHLLTVLPERLVANSEADIDDLLPWIDNMRQLFGTGNY
jgi:hypothetical protein